jgi:putative nucleotidyltransferase with HDIG domain
MQSHYSIENVGSSKDAVLRRIQRETLLSPAAIQVFFLTQGDVNLRHIAAAVNTDPPLAAHVLRLANTPLFGVRFGVTSILQAVAVLGIDRLRAITTTAAMRLLVSPRLHCPALKRCWRHSVACAWISQELASDAGTDGNVSYLCGLLHDIGRYALFSSWTREYSLLLDRTPADQYLDAELTMFRITHAEIGAFLLEHWGFPEDFIEVAHHHHQQPTGDSKARLPQIVTSACRLAAAAGFSLSPEPTPGNLGTDCLPDSPDFCFKLADAVNQIESL